jgi:hypothetical protein
MVAYCSSCREDRGRHTLRGSRSSSHDSRRRYLSDAYLEKSPIIEVRTHRHNARRSDGHRGSMIDVFLALHQSDITQAGGASPRRVQAREATLGGELIMR